jgi:prepilin-type N-terminal cleavage/methylation domain-containing protein
MLQFFSRRRGEKGFTLIELLVVIAIIGILASIVLVALGSARKKARDAARQSDIRQITTAMEMCYAPSDCGAGGEKYVDTLAGANTVGNIDTDQAPCYLCPVPTDPLNSSLHQYTWTDGTDQYFCVYTKLEGETDTYFCGSNKGVQKKTAANYTPSNTDCCGMDVTK